MPASHPHLFRLAFVLLVLLATSVGAAPAHAHGGHEGAFDTRERPEAVVDPDSAEGAPRPDLAPREADVHAHAPTDEGRDEYAVDRSGPAPEPDSAVAAALRPEQQRGKVADPRFDTVSSAVCLTNDTSKENVSAQRSSQPQIKVIYATPSDVAPEYEAHAEAINRTAAAISEQWRDSVGAWLRFDTGTSCGPTSLDVRVVRLDHPASYYDASSSTRFGRVRTDLDAALAEDATQPAARNRLVFLQGLSTGGVAGEGSMWMDDSYASRYQNRGGGTAIVYGTTARSAPWFYRSSTNEALLRDIAGHELGHNLGAVQNGAPQSSGAGHCTDGTDVMCYADGGPKGAYSALVCPAVSSSAPDPIDCGGDTYANANPAAGTWLATHWNLARSAFLCRTDCGVATSGTPSTTTPTPAPTTGGTRPTPGGSGSTGSGATGSGSTPTGGGTSTGGGASTETGGRTPSVGSPVGGGASGPTPDPADATDDDGEDDEAGDDGTADDGDALESFTGRWSLRSTAARRTRVRVSRYTVRRRGGARARRTARTGGDVTVRFRCTRSACGPADAQLRRGRSRVGAELGSSSGTPVGGTARATFSGPLARGRWTVRVNGRTVGRLRVR